MKIKSRHVIWLVYILYLVMYAIGFHFTPRTDADGEGDMCCASGAVGVFIILVIGTVIEECTTRKSKKPPPPDESENP